MRRIWSLAIVLGLAMTATAAKASPAGTYFYADILKPHGRARSEAVKLADGRACGSAHTLLIGTPKFDACMAARGWRMARFAPAPAKAAPAAVVANANPYGDNNVWVNISKRKRGDAALRLDTQYCLDATGPDPVGQETSPALKQCMLSRGWKFDHTDGTGAFIDPDTGLECRNNGFASICGAPSHPVDYTNRHGLSCHRDGLISVCSNL